VNKYQRETLKAPVPSIENAYILCSASWRDKTEEDRGVHPHISFLYDAGDIAAEWGTEHGPIFVWHKCSRDAPDAREHYFYDFVNDKSFNFSQLAVDRAELPAAFEAGHWAHIFAELKEWAQR